MPKTNEDGERLMAENPEFMAALIVALMMRFGVSQVRVTAQDMMETQGYGLRLRSPGAEYMDVSVVGPRGETTTDIASPGLHYDDDTTPEQKN